MHVAVESTEMSSFFRHRDSDAKMVDIDVAVKRLDTVFPEAIAGVENPRIFLKMDTQGYDLEVIRGATRSIEEVVGVQSELSIEAVYDHMPHFLEALRIYGELGFELAGLHQIAANAAESTIMEMNCLMVRPQGGKGMGQKYQ